VKGSKPSLQKKTVGTAIVERHRPAMNKLLPSKRRRLGQRAAELITSS